MTTRSLEGKKALVTGAGRGLGRAMAVVLAERGADVALWARHADELEESASLVRATGSRAETRVMDVTDTAGLDAAVEEIAVCLGGLDILVNNAGVNHPAPALEITEDVWDRVLAVNLKAPFFLACAAVKRMRHGGRIVNITSSLARNVLDRRAPY